MTTDWKPTIHQAYTTPNLSNPVLQQAIPSLIRDEIHRLANITLFKNNVHSNHNTSQVPVDMRFTDDSLNIRISKNGPWISLLPSKNPLSPEEQSVDLIRREVMEKIALLWGGIPNSSSDESDHQHTDTPGSSGRDRNSRSTRTRSKRSRRAQQNKGMNDGEKSPITISKNKIDSSTHTTNNYYCCHSGSQHLLPNIGKAETETPKKNMYTQTDPTIDLSKNFQEINSLKDSRDNFDSSSDESKQSSTSSSDSNSEIGNKTSTSRDDSDTNDVESESSSYAKQQPSTNKVKQDSFQDQIKKSKKNLRKKRHTTATIPKEIPAWIKLAKKKTKDFKDPLEKKDSNFQIENISEKFRNVTITDPTNFSNASHTRPMPDTSIKVDTMPTLRKIPSQAEDQFAAIKKFIEEYSTESKPVSQRKAFFELQAELTQSQPNIARVNNLLSILKADSLQLGIEMPAVKNHQESIASQPEEIENRTNSELQPVVNNSTYHLETFVSDKKLEKLRTFLKDSIKETEVWIELAQSNADEEEIIESLSKNRDILVNIERLLISDPELIADAAQVNRLLNQLDLDTLRLTHNNYDLEVPIINENFDDESTLLRPVKEQLLPSEIDTSVQTDTYQSDEEIELIEKLQELSARFEQLDENISLNTHNSLTTSTLVQTDDYRTEKEIKLQKKVQLLSKKYENLAGGLLKQSRAGEQQELLIRELKFNLDHTKNELVDALRRNDDDLLPSVTMQSVVASDDEQQDVSELLDKYEKVSQDLQKVKEDDLEMLEEFHSKYATSGIHIQLNLLTEYLRDNQNPLYPERDIVFKRRQDVLDMLHLAERKLSERDSGYSSSESSDATSAVLIESSLDEELITEDSPAIDNREENISRPNKNTVTANASTQYERAGIADASTQDERSQTTHTFTQVEKTPLSNASTQAGRDTIDASNQVNNQSEREIELQFQSTKAQDERDDISRRFEKLAEFVDREFKSTEEQLEYTRKLETQVQALEDANENLVAAITALKNRKILPKVQENILEAQSIEDEEKSSHNVEDKKTEPDPVFQTEILSTTFDELSPSIKNLFSLYREVNSDLTEIQDISSVQRLYEKYRESNVIADLTNFVNSVSNIEPVTDIALPSQQQIRSLIEQVQQLFLDGKEKKDSEFAELEKDFDQRLNIYNELTSDLAKVQKKQLTLAELHNKYADSKAIGELEIFARQNRDSTPSKESVENKITSLRKLLIEFDNNLESTDF